MKILNLGYLASLKILLLVSQLQAQEYFPFPQDSAEWHIVRSYPWPHPPYIYFDTWKFEMQGDTLINDIVYKKVMYSINEHPHYNYFGAFRVEEESKKVYYLDDFLGNEIIAYDFNLFPNDSLYINGSHYICLDTGLIQLNNGNFSKYQIMYVSLPVDCFQTWVEGIGSLNFPLVETLYHCGYTFESSNNLTCFFYKGEKIYEWADNPYFQGCSGFNTGIEQISASYKFAIAPNPVTELSTLVSNLCYPSLIDYKVYDIHGRIIAEEYEKYCHEVVIKVGMYSKGVYLLRCYLQSTDIHHSIKFIVK